MGFAHQNGDFMLFHPENGVNFHGIYATKRGDRGDGFLQGPISPMG